MADKIRELFVELLLDTKKFSAGLKDSEGKMVNFERVAKSLAIGVTAIGTAAAVTATAMAVITKQTVDQGDKFDKLSQRIGINVEKLSAYEHVANLAGTSLEGMTIGVRRLSQNMNDAANGIGEGKEAFSALNISVKESSGKLKDADSIMLEVADRFSKMDDGAQKTALAMDLFGRSGADLIPMFNQGADGMREMLEEGTRLRGWTTEQAKQAAELKDNMARLTTGIGGVKDSIGKQLIPVVNAIIEMTNEWYVSNQELIQNSISKIPTIINDYVLPSIFSILNVMNEVKTGFSMAWESLNIIVIDAIRFLVESLDSLLSAIPERILNIIPGAENVKDAIEDMARSAEDISIEMKNEHIKNIDESNESYKKFQIDLINMQDTILNKVEITQGERKKIVVDTNNFIIESNQKITDEEKKEGEKRLRNDQRIADDLARLTKSTHDYKIYQLDQSYNEYSQHTNDQLSLGRWYAEQEKRIDQQEREDNKKDLEERYNNANTYWERLKLGRELDFENYKEHENRQVEYADKTNQLLRDINKASSDAIVDAYIEGENMKQAATEATKKVVTSALSNMASESLQKVIDYVTQTLTAFIAKGLGIASSTDVDLWENLKNIGLYSAEVVGALALAKPIAKGAFAKGGWLLNNPGGGKINSGSTSRADDVFLGFKNGYAAFGSKNEFVVNANSTAMFLPLLEEINKVGLANGGELSNIKNELEGNLQFGTTIAAVNGWEESGGGYAGIPAAVGAAITHLATTVGTDMLIKQIFPSILKANGGVMADLPHEKIAKDIMQETLKKKIMQIYGNKIIRAVMGSYAFAPYAAMMMDPKITSVNSTEDVSNYFGDFSNKIDDEISKYYSDDQSTDTLGDFFNRDPVDVIKDIGSTIVDDAKDVVDSLKDAFGFSRGGQINFAHSGGMMTAKGLVPLRNNERLTVTKVGETIRTAQQESNLNRNITININTVLSESNVRRFTRDYFIPALNYEAKSRGKFNISRGKFNIL
ncbi:MAG: hypothetical protein ACFFG0_04615 [Candidatus Thorarchaeota archaeon]